MVNRLFEDEFNKRMGGVTRLNYEQLQWTDKAAVAVCKVIATGVLKKLEELRLDASQIGDAGVMALAEAAEKGTLPQLKTLYLQNQIGDAGGALAEAAKGTLPQLGSSTSRQPDWRCRRDGAGGGGGEGHAAAAQELWLGGDSTISQQAKDALKAALPN